MLQRVQYQVARLPGTPIMDVAYVGVLDAWHAGRDGALYVCSTGTTPLAEYDVYWHEGD